MKGLGYPKTTLATYMVRVALAFTLIFTGWTAVAAEAQQSSAGGSIHGTVLGPDSLPLAAVRVTIVELNRSTSSAEDGGYLLRALPRGVYTVSFARLGVAPVVRRVQLTGDTRLDVVLQPSLVELPAVQAVATSRAGSVFASPQPTSVLDASALRTAQHASVGDALEGLPGVRSLSMSPGIGKPVIRGLTSNRVVVIDDGQRLETQQWGSDHAPNTEISNASRIEVLRGPASVLYGSDALGGVINIVRPPPPHAAGGDAFLRTRMSSAYSSNPGGAEVTAAIEGAGGPAGLRLTATRRATSDLHTPVQRLSNTANAATNLDVGASVRGSRATVTAGYVTRGERIEIYEDPVEFTHFTGYQRIFERRAVLRTELAAGAERFEFSATHERNERREFDDVEARDVTLGLLARTATAQLSWHHRALGAFSGTAGASWLQSDFEKFGTETLIPANASRNAAVFLFEQGELGRWILSAGARYDTRVLRAESDTVLQMDSDRRSWQAFSGNVGALYRMSDPVAVVLNLGRGFRAPSAADLFSNGYHEGTRAFERGDPTLGVETSLNVDLAVRAQTSSLNAEAGVFMNRIRDYIYLQPQGSLDTLLHASGDAILSGVEAFADYALTRAVSLRATGDYTRGQNTTLGVPLTQIPPARVTLRMLLQPAALGSMRRPYGSLTWEGVAPQRRLHPGDVGTAGYGLLGAGTGATFTWGGRVATVDVVARNLLDRSYRNFMSVYRTIAEAPGRSVSIRVDLAL
jgi:iron complex outermembrane recepter protein